MEKKDDLKDFKNCPTCGYSFKGRKNKKFCSLNCKTIANNQIAFLRNQRVKESIHNYKNNVEILISLFESGVREIWERDLLSAGYKPGICFPRRDRLGKLAPGYEEITICSTETPKLFKLNHENATD
jgi:hypothetical protein